MIIIKNNHNFKTNFSTKKRKKRKRSQIGMQISSKQKIGTIAKVEPQLSGPDSLLASKVFDRLNTETKTMKMIF